MTPAHRPALEFAAPSVRVTAGIALRGRARIAAGVSLFAATAIMSVAVVRAGIKPPTSVAYHNKAPVTLDDRIAGDPQIVILGSSRAVFGLDPKIIELATGKRTVNASLTAMRVQEMGEIIDYYLDRAPHADTFIIELQSPIPQPLVTLTERQTAWYTLPNTIMLLDATWREGGLPASVRRQYTSDHLKLFAIRNRIFGAAYGPEIHHRSDPTRDGDIWRKKHADALAQVLAGQHQRRYSESPATAAFYATIIRKIGDRGIEPVFVMLPQVFDNDLAVAPILRSYVGDCRVIDLAVIPENSDLYHEPLWVDPYHIGGDGAKLMTERLAAALDADQVDHELGRAI